MGTKQCTASVLEALMGFEEQQSLHHASRHSRVLSEGYLQRVASIGVPNKKSPSKCHPFRMIVEEPIELFNTLELGDSFKSDRSCNELGDREKESSALSSACMPLRRHNCMRVKHFPTDKMIQTSNDLQELPEVIDSMDISPRPTREKEYILNHVKNGLSVSKSHFTLTQGNNDAGTKLANRKQGQACSSDDFDLLLKSSIPFLEWKDKLCFSSSSLTSSEGFHLVSERCKYIHGSQNGKHVAKEKERKTMVYAVEPIKQPSQVSRILDVSGRKTRHDFVNLNMKASRSESVYDDMHRKETEYRRTSSPGLSNSKAKYKHSCCFSVESFKARGSREKAIKEKMETEKLMLSRQGRKKNDMPILHHYVTFPNDLNCKPVKYDFQKHVCSNKEHLHSGSPLCLSYKDERLEQLSKNSHRLRFCSPASVTTTRSRTRSRYESLRNTWFLKSEGPATWLQCKLSDKSSNGKDASDPTLKLGSKKLRIFPCPDSASGHIVDDGCIGVGDLMTRVEKKSLCNQHSINSPSSRHNIVFCADNNPVQRQNQAIECSLKSDYQDDNFSGMASNVLGVKTDDVEVPTVDEQEPDSISCSLSETDGDSSTNSFRTTCPSIQQEASTIFNKEGPGFEHYPGKVLDYIVSLEEAYQPSPVSVLEPLFKEETLSSSESSGINSRDLMMQLELLMSDSPGSNSEGHEMFVSSDDDGGGEVSKCSSEEIDDIMSTFKFKDSRDFSYLLDVLSEAGLYCKNLDKGCVSWDGQERHVISPSVFETLEKKFGEQNSWRRSERKLLFDRINSGLIELFQSFVGVPEWAKPVSRRFWPLLDREMIEEELWILLDSQEREVNKDLVDKQFGKEIGWIDLGDEIDSICRELERLLITELVAEFGINGYL